MLGQALAAATVRESAGVEVDLAEVTFRLRPLRMLVRAAANAGVRLRPVVAGAEVQRLLDMFGLHDHDHDHDHGRGRGLVTTDDVGYRFESPITNLPDITADDAIAAGRPGDWPACSVHRPRF